MTSPLVPLALATMRLGRALAETALEAHPGDPHQAVAALVTALTIAIAATPKPLATLTLTAAHLATSHDILPGLTLDAVKAAEGGGDA